MRFGIYQRYYIRPKTNTLILIQYDPIPYTRIYPKTPSHFNISLGSSSFPPTKMAPTKITAVKIVTPEYCNL